MKLRCIQIPATAQLQAKDIVYRCNAASAVAIVAVGEDEIAGHILPRCRIARA
jgi:hypothetical protein